MDGSSRSGQVTGHGGIVLDEHFWHAEMVSAVSSGMARLADPRTDEQIEADQLAEVRRINAERTEWVARMRVDQATGARPVLRLIPRARARESCSAPSRRSRRAVGRGGDSGDPDEPEPPGGRPLHLLAHPDHGRVNRALARFLEEAA